MSVNVATADKESLRSGIKNLARWGAAMAEMFPPDGFMASCRPLSRAIVFACSRCHMVFVWLKFIAVIYGSIISRLPKQRY